MVSVTLFCMLLASATIQESFALPAAVQPSLDTIAGLSGNFKDFPPGFNRVVSGMNMNEGSSGSDPKAKLEEIKPQVIQQEPIQQEPITQTRVQKIREKVHDFLHKTKDRVKSLFGSKGSESAIVSHGNSSVSHGEGPFVEKQTLIGDPRQNGYNFVFKGPILSIEVYPGENAIRGIKVKNISGNETLYGTAASSMKAKPPGRFTFDDKEKIDQLVIRTSGGGKTLSGLEFLTDKGRKYSALCNNKGHGVVKRKVGSGIMGQVRGVLGVHPDENSSDPVVLSIGIDMVDEVESIKMIYAGYEGFDKGGQRVAEKGETMIAGSQILDNRNSTVQQSFMFTLSKAISKSYSFLLMGMATVGADITLGTEVAVPIIKLFRGTGAVTTHWSLAITASATLTWTETISQGAMFSLQCLPQKFCEAESVFNTYRLDTKFKGRFQLITKSGEKFEWWSNGVFKAADITDLRLVVNQYDNEPRTLKTKH